MIGIFVIKELSSKFFRQKPFFVVQMSIWDFAKVSSQLAFTCSKLTIETVEQGVKYAHSLRRSGDFIVNFEHILHLVLVFLLLILNMYLPTGIAFCELDCASIEKYNW